MADITYKTAIVLNALYTHRMAVCNRGVITELPKLTTRKIYQLADAPVDDPEVIIIATGKIKTRPKVAGMVIFCDVPDLQVYQLLGLSQNTGRALKVWKQLCTNAAGSFDHNLILSPYGWPSVVPKGVSNCIAAIDKPTLDAINTCLECYEMIFVDAIMLHVLNIILMGGNTIIVTHYQKTFDTLLAKCADISKVELDKHVSVINKDSKLNNVNIAEFSAGETSIMLVDARYQLERVPFTSAKCVLAAWGNYPMLTIPDTF